MVNAVVQNPAENVLFNDVAIDQGDHKPGATKTAVGKLPSRPAGVERIRRWETVRAPRWSPARRSTTWLCRSWKSTVSCEMMECASLRKSATIVSVSQPGPAIPVSRSSVCPWQCRERDRIRWLAAWAPLPADRGATECAELGRDCRRPSLRQLIGVGTFVGSGAVERIEMEWRRPGVAYTRSEHRPVDVVGHDRVRHIVRDELKQIGVARRDAAIFLRLSPLSIDAAGELCH